MESKESMNLSKIFRTAFSQNVDFPPGFPAYSLLSTLGYLDV